VRDGNEMVRLDRDITPYWSSRDDLANKISISDSEMTLLHNPEGTSITLS
jgi:DNA-binding Xre family transcriptional regulator